ncbi:hypothetical protein QQP08_019532 [Theobroma cacao]|uniref:Uncharacterized protein n=1 Tax=Theobroma cacao TaxID=3641 RepID=A0A061G9N9_THECC|nr:Uncharacterized protein TCM_028428 [Theobroma cacao]WRX27045.1 hypothetical protein QQP08_019532 [Theobroma cacao]
MPDSRRWKEILDTYIAPTDSKKISSHRAGITVVGRRATLEKSEKLFTYDGHLVMAANVKHSNMKRWRKAKPTSHFAQLNNTLENDMAMELALNARAVRWVVEPDTCGATDSLWISFYFFSNLMLSQLVCAFSEQNKRNSW